MLLKEEEIRVLEDIFFPSMNAPSLYQAFAYWPVDPIPGGGGVRGQKTVCVPKIDLQVRGPR